MQRKFFYLLLVIIPVFVLGTSLETIHTRGFNWYGGGYDPEYCYLLNSLNNANLKPVGHIDHPGTTSQVFGAVVLRTYHLFDRSDIDLRTAVLNNPERYLFVLNYAFLALNCLFLFFTGILVLKATGSPWLAALLQAAPFFSAAALFNGLTRVSQESMLLLSALMMLTLVAWQFQRGWSRGGRKNILLFAFVTGFGMASKIIFFPLVILPLILIPGIWNKVKYIIFSICSFIVLTFPIWTQYGRMLNWFSGLLIHTGQYGSGATGIIDKSAYFSNLLNLLASGPVFLIVVAVSLLFLILIMVIPGLRRNFKASIEIKVLLATTIVEIAGLILVAKMPSNHYMLSYSSLLALNVFSMISVLRHSRYKIITGYIIPALVMVILIIIPLTGIKAKNLLYTPMANKEYEITVDLLAKYDDSYARLYCLPSSSLVPSLFFGNIYARQEYRSDLEQKYPNAFFYEAPNRKLWTWDHTIDFKNLISIYGNKIVILNQLRGFPFTQEDFAFLSEQGLTLTDVFKGQYQTIYEVSISTDSAGVSQKGTKEILCDAEKLSDDQQSCLSANGYKFAMSGTRSDEKAHSGKFSARLTPAAPYAMTITLDTIAPGDIFEVSVWRQGSKDDGCLVAAGPDAASFYSQTCASVINDAGGWNKLLLSFSLPESMKGKYLKIYTWNSGKSTLYFDDLQIIKKN
ncbi:MAG: hypothetical protein WCM93_06940 [Bacteroidota bacterium]